jgi:hypothetical protein
MHTRAATIALLLSVFAPTSNGQTPTPKYAIYGIKNTSQQSQVTSINVGVIPTGNLVECQRQIDVYEEGMRKRGLPANVQLVPSKCTATLSTEFQAMVRGQRLKDAYVVVASGDWAPVFTAWYNIPPSDTAAVCKQLLDGMRATLPSSKATFNCQPPL